MNKITNILLIALIAVTGYFGIHNKPAPAPVVNAGAAGAVLFSPPLVTHVTVGSTATLVLATSTSRLYAAIVNDSSDPIYLSIGAGTTTGNGVRLNANGGSYEITGDNLYTGGIYATGSGGDNVTVMATQ